MPSRKETLDTWIKSLLSGQFRHLFDHLPGTLFFAKNREALLMAGNPAFVQRCGFTNEEDIVGLADTSIFPPKLAAKYRKDDEQVMTSGKPLLGLIELFPNPQGKPEWYITDKIPLFDQSGQICGLCGTVRSYEAQRAGIQPYLELAEVADHLKVNYRDKLDVHALARLASMSVRQFERKFRNTFQMTPRDYLIRMRVIESCQLLSRSNLPITTIALEVGFYDHSDFARQFRRHMGQTARDYRNEHQSTAPSPPLD